MDDSSALANLLEAAQCPVCFNRLPPSVYCCLNGHAVCDKCYSSIDRCPSCREPLCKNKNITLSQILAALPHWCRHSGCDEISWNVEEHETYCGFRPTECKKCLWKGTVRELYVHIACSHALSDIGKLQHVKQLELCKPCHLVRSMMIAGQLFWRITYNNTVKNTLSFQFICVPLNKVNDKIYLTIEFKKGELMCVMKIELSLDGKDCNANRLTFNSDMMKMFLEENHTLVYKIVIE